MIEETFKIGDAVRVMLPGDQFDGMVGVVVSAPKVSQCASDAIEGSQRTRHVVFADGDTWGHLFCVSALQRMRQDKF